MNKMASAVVLALAFYGAQSFAATEAKPVSVDMKNAKGESVGVATLTPLVKGVKIDLDLHGLTPGEHALHFHENGTCTAPEFKSAGGHFSPNKMKHGFDMKGGPHQGDMSNFFASADGTAKLEVVNEEVTLGKGSASLMKTGGTALVIHEKADDYKSQPAGEAGGRFACGEIKQ